MSVSEGAPSRPSALCLAGPTASGKSALAMAIAQRWPVEIISVDSAQVYRGLDIGSAKPSAAEQALVPHHLIDILPPTQPYSAAAFVHDAQRVMGEVQARGRLPLLVGGTMLYFKALREGLSAMPAADPTVRAELEAEAAAQGWPALHAQLAQVDAASAARLKPMDSQRIQRALEVWRLTGQPLSHWQQQEASTALPLPLLALEPASRAWLHERIAQRFDAMLAQGLMDEVRRLRATPGLQAELPAMRAVGYRQAWEALDRGEHISCRDTGIAATRQLAKRQLTWLRGWNDKTSLACDAPEALRDTLAWVTGHWGQAPHHPT
jgi:tRNA dimethylallyltransferase